MLDNPIPIRIKAARQKANISQKELGIRIGMDINSASSRMNHYEKGRHTPDIQTLKKIADELNVPLVYLFCESDVIAELNCKIHQLSVDDQKQLLESLNNSDKNK
ncbi:helix-turn-helix transcriptional regulator [Colwellia sp. 6_MG-2023]|uniref:helix-turn-helix domain-containing protein n=1 Tax=Colwellia sp. 6_MG-2023 TaxID=3062676 RepID=UPI0026E47A68|nr:helix-turn-helix transcriptional regulator [Colwellia sp. 6_MG-2023]MDO6488433.1 helix-turn-helix transcriptional regulator [Colwellia sp. 6_MG-2023]